MLSILWIAICIGTLYMHGLKPNTCQQVECVFIYVSDFIRNLDRCKKWHRHWPLIGRFHLLRILVYLQDIGHNLPFSSSWKGSISPLVLVLKVTFVLDTKILKYKIL